MAILFHYASGRKRIVQHNRIKAWLLEIISRENAVAANINIILTSDDHLLELNREFLTRDYFTDIITFDFSEGNRLSGDLFISLERVRENAKQLNVAEKEELLRVIAHGILHLLGYNDKTGREKNLMRKKEDYYLKKIFPVS